MPLARRPRIAHVLDLFAGPGGWDVGAHWLGFSPLGIEWDQAACKTRLAAGLPTIRADVRDLDPLTFLAVWLLIASPPCQTFSAAGKRAGAGELEHLVAHIKDVMAAGAWHEPSYPWQDERTGLVLQPLRFIAAWYAAGRPVRRIALEQVPGVLPVWEAYAVCLREWGYSVDVAVISAEQYGVPQTRKRAVLVASLDREAKLPTPTHEAYRKGKPRGADAKLLPWVSMAEALGWGFEDSPARTMCGDRTPRWMYGSANSYDTGRTVSVGFPRTWNPRARGAADAEGFRERDWRHGDEPSFGLTEKARSWTVRTGNNSMVTGRTGSKAGDGDVQAYERSVNDPAPTLDTGAGSKWRVNTGMDWKPGGTRADAQSFDADERPATSLTARSGRQWQLQSRRDSDNFLANYGERPNRDGGEPAPTMTGKAHRWQLRNNTSEKAGVRELDEPAPTMYFGARLNTAMWQLRHSKMAKATIRGLDEPAGTVAFGNDMASAVWTQDRPATTVACDPRLHPPGHKINAADVAAGRTHYEGRAGQNAVRLSVEQAAVLQSFPVDYPWQGNRTAQFGQIGNAVPPLMAYRVLESLCVTRVQRRNRQTAPVRRRKVVIGTTRRIA